jgi:hypothetical protein
MGFEQAHATVSVEVERGQRERLAVAITARERVQHVEAVTLLRAAVGIGIAAARLSIPGAGEQAAARRSSRASGFVCSIERQLGEAS